MNGFFPILIVLYFLGAAESVFFNTVLDFSEKINSGSCFKSNTR